ncbi:hypothetical protein T06_3927 [Trichinella sp. T6]|nr:hypothetical protein T06_3927 [Trichinella sp. T6]
MENSVPNEITYSNILEAFVMLWNCFSLWWWNLS